MIDEVLSLLIENVKFEKKVIEFPNQSINFPKHLFQDLREYIGDRKLGSVFTGKNAAKLDHSVTYRALKTVISKLKLDPSLTFKDFARNK